MANGSCHITTALRRLVGLGLLIACCQSVLGEQIRLDSLKVGSKSYKKVAVLGFNLFADGLTEMFNPRASSKAPKLQS